LQELKAGGLTENIALSAARKNCTLTKNFCEALQKLKYDGCILAIISGGADVVLRSLIPNAKEFFGDNVYINKLRFDTHSGQLIDIEPTPYDWDDDGKVRGVQGKHAGLRKLCREHGISLENTVFVGDDDNDFKAMKIAGTKILYSSCDPDDSTVGTGSRKLPEGIILVTQNDLMIVADIIIKTPIRS
jgi:phosphoserine phosphatase